MEKLANNSAEYLFFIGTTFISLLLLNKHKWIIAKLVFLLGVAWIVFYKPIYVLITNLGIDSFNEARDFDIEEAKFWISTVGKAIHPNFSFFSLALYLVLSVASFLFLRWLLSKHKFTEENYSYVKFSIAIMLIGLAVYHTVSESITMFFANSESFITTKHNFANLPPPIASDKRNINVLVYIGESTTIMNMGIYGYPRNTTPKLAELVKSDSNLLVFKNIFSTHTHTSSSLLEALSFAIDQEENYLPINERKRISIIDLLSNAGIQMSLISNQGITGTWNQASSIIFNKADKMFSTKSKLLGGSDSEIERPWDNDFFSLHLGKSLAKKTYNKKLIFLHSYSGHGKYLNNIPESFRLPVDDFFKGKEVESIVGANFDLLPNVEGYDSAVKYIDFSVTQTISYIKNIKDPTIFLYFSDHGESVYEGRGHDSARFIHEMARIPFLIYFNDAAREAYPELYDHYKKLSHEENISTLAQLSSTLLNLLGISVSNENARAIVLTPVIGEKTAYPPIVVRRTTEGITYVNINSTALQIPKKFNQKFIDMTDKATKNYVSARNKDQNSIDACASVLSTFGEMRRRDIVADCPRAKSDNN